MTWSLFSKEGKFLEPLKYSNGKSQEDVVSEVIKAIKDGHKVIFIKGMCGSGKSALALNIAKELGKASIVVPVKYLQKQYEKDYTEKMYLMRDGKKINIKILTGRANHKCLYDKASNADNPFLPCDIEIKKDNFDLLMKYVKENPFVDEEDFESVKDIRRFSVAPACPYWSPIVLKEYSYNQPMNDVTKYNYKGLLNQDFVYLKRKHGCSYYEQFMGYIFSDVIIFNSKKYEIENLIGRKPATDVEIIDECDEFLDKLGNEKKINLVYLKSKLKRCDEICKDKAMKDLIMEIFYLVEDIEKSIEARDSIENDKILKIKDSKILKLLEIFIKNSFLAEFEDLEYYYLAAKNFEDFFDDTYLQYSLNEKNHVIVTIVNINLEKKLNFFLERNRVFVMMSGTLHSEKVLKEIFGLKDFAVIEAETGNIGSVKKIFTKMEKNFRYSEFEKGNVTREGYLTALDKCVEISKRPTLIHVNSFYDLPSEQEKEKFNINVMSREKLREQQEKYKHGELLQLFKESKIKILYSTKCNRGIDLPGEMCNSIVYTKYPFPDVWSIFWRVLKASKPDKFNSFYFDKARREFLQRLYRGLRSKDDKVEILSPDLMVLNSS